MSAYVIEKNGKYLAETGSRFDAEWDYYWVDLNSPKMSVYARKDVAKGMAKQVDGNVIVHRA